MKWACDTSSAFLVSLSKTLARKDMYKEVIGGRRKCIRENSMILIMDPWGCISHGVTARWSIGFLSSLRRDLRRHQAPMKSHGPVHLPARSPPRWKLSFSLSLSLLLAPSRSLRFPPTSARGNPCLQLIWIRRTKEITTDGKKRGGLTRETGRSITAAN